MKALTLWQPWATLVAIEAKRYETRSWYSGHRDWLAIHAAAKSPGWALALAKKDPFASALSDVGVFALPSGVIVAVCKVAAEVQMREGIIAKMSQREKAFGDWQLGRYAWGLTNVHRVEPPIPARGRQKLWDWDAPPEVLALLVDDDLAAMCGQTVICPKCHRAVRIRKDGRLPKHNMHVGRGWMRGVAPCPARETFPMEWRGFEPPRTPCNA